VATALYVAAALPGLVFGWIATTKPLGLPCEPEYSLLDTFGVTTGEACRTVDFSVLYWLAPTVVLLTIGVSIAAGCLALIAFAAVGYAMLRLSAPRSLRWSERGSRA
jgi:hypothetical protein